MVDCSWADKPVFRRFKAAQKETVTNSAPSNNSGADVCTWIAPQEWSALVDDPNTVVFDISNSYDSAIDRFQSTMDPFRARGIQTTGVIDSKPSPFRDSNQIRHSGRP